MCPLGAAFLVPLSVQIPTQACHFKLLSVLISLTLYPECFKEVSWR